MYNFLENIQLADDSEIDALEEKQRKIIEDSKRQVLKQTSRTTLESRSGSKRQALMPLGLMNQTDAFMNGSTALSVR